MFIFCHLGIGKKLAAPFSKGLSVSAVLLGTLLPDILDKSLYYGLKLFPLSISSNFHIISGTRTFGHTAIFLFILTLIAALKRSRILAAICLGITTHLLLDGLDDFLYARQVGSSHIISPLLWPFTVNQFPISIHKTIPSYLSSHISRPYMIAGEVIGLLILMWDFRSLFKKRGIRSHGSK